MPKTHNALRSREIKAAAETFANLHKADAKSMLSLALNGSERVYSKSFKVEKPATPTNPFPTYLIEQASKLPWNGLTATENRGFSTCAEAHVWLELMGRGKNPKNYTLVAFNADGIIAAPCSNCEQWVGKAFGAVYRETTSYRFQQAPAPQR